MYPAKQHSAEPSAPPPYATGMRLNDGRDYHTTSEERMVDFQQLVGRYESELVFLKY